MLTWEPVILPLCITLMKWEVWITKNLSSWKLSCFYVRNHIGITFLKMNGKKKKNTSKHQGKYGEVAIYQYLSWYTEIYVVTDQSKTDRLNKDFFIWKTSKQHCWKWYQMYSLCHVHCHRLLIEHLQYLYYWTCLWVVNWIEMGSLNHTILQSYRLLLKHNFNEKKNVPKHIGYF